MRLNFLSSTSLSKHDSALGRFLSTAAIQLAKEYDVNTVGTTYLLNTQEGRELMKDFLESRYNLKVRFWHWEQGGQTIASGIDIMDSKELTTLILQYEDKV